MNRNEFGLLVSTLRKEQLDVTDNRVWTQKTLSKKTGLSQRVIEDIERGVKVNLEQDILLRLASAFRLTPLERMKFFSLVTETDNRDLLTSNHEAGQTLKEIKQFAEGIRTPLFVHDVFHNLVFTNHIWLRFTGVTADFFETNADSFAKFNLLRLVVDPTTPLNRTIGFVPEDFALRNIQYFRYLTFEFRHTRYFNQLMIGLSQFAKFQRFWESVKYADEDFFTQSSEYSYSHRDFGQVNYGVAVTMRLAIPHNLFIVVLLPKDTATQKVFETIANEVGLSTQEFAQVSILE